MVASSRSQVSIGYVTRRARQVFVRPERQRPRHVQEFLAPAGERSLAPPHGGLGRAPPSTLLLQLVVDPGSVSPRATAIDLGRPSTKAERRHARRIVHARTTVRHAVAVRVGSTRTPKNAATEAGRILTPHPASTLSRDASSSRRPSSRCVQPLGVSASGFGRDRRPRCVRAERRRAADHGPFDDDPAGARRT
jgi:hypothetical protein